MSMRGFPNRKERENEQQIRHLKGLLDLYLLLNGSDAMTGNLDMGTYAITNVGNVDNVDISALSTDVNGFPDELKNLDPTEIIELENIGATTITAAQWGILGGLTATLTATELNYIDGVTSAVQTQLNAMLPKDGSEAMTGNLDINNNNINNVNILKLKSGGLIYTNGASPGSESGEIGWNGPGSYQPFNHIVGKYLEDDDGSLGSYSQVDDLQLLRDLKEWDIREKPMCKDHPNTTQKVWDMNTLPWIKAHPEIDKLDNDDNAKRYALSLGARDGYYLSVLKKMLGVIDDLQARITELENKK